MKNITFFDHTKCNVNQKVNSTEGHKIEIRKEDIKDGNLKQKRELKLDFQFIEIDKAFAN